jgi:hypothetical protein
MVYEPNDVDDPDDYQPFGTPPPSEDFGRRLRPGEADESIVGPLLQKTAGGPGGRNRRVLGRVSAPSSWQKTDRMMYAPIMMYVPIIWPRMRARLAAMPKSPARELCTGPHRGFSGVVPGKW